MDYFHWIGGTVLLVYGVSQMGLRIYVLFAILWLPTLLLIMEMLSGWIATVAALASLALVGRVMRGPVRRRRQEREQSGDR